MVPNARGGSRPDGGGGVRRFFTRFYTNGSIKSSLLKLNNFEKMQWQNIFVQVKYVEKCNNKILSFEVKYVDKCNVKIISVHGEYFLKCNDKSYLSKLNTFRNAIVKSYLLKLNTLKMQWQNHIHVCSSGIPRKMKIIPIQDECFEKWS